MPGEGEREEEAINALASIAGLELFGCVYNAKQ